MTQRYDDQMRITELDRPARSRRPRRRLWLIASPLILVLLLAAGWSAFWFYASAQATARIAQWQERESQAGRTFACATQDIGGFPFRFEVSCGEPSLELSNLRPEILLAGKFTNIVAQIYDPTLLIGEFTGPLTVAELGVPANASVLPPTRPMFSANWKLARASLRGLPGAPERLSIVFDSPELARMARAAMEPVAAADRFELHSRVLSDAPGNGAVEIALRLAGGAAPTLNTALAQPTDADADVKISGIRDLAPKPLATYLRELSETNGRIEIVNARIAQADIIVTGNGTLGVTTDGMLDGQVALTVVGLERLIKLLGLEDMLNQQFAQRGGSMDKIASGLDRLLPGLGGAVRSNSGTIAAAGIAMLGAPTELEGKKAVTLPLKFSAGLVSLGPLQIGRMPPVF